jgi:hypothetical protein
MSRSRSPHPGLLALAIVCAIAGWLELTFACVDGDQLPGAVCSGGHLTLATWAALLLAAFAPTVMASRPVRWRATAIVVLCLLVPFCLGYLRIGA